jgi:hypothetical protein
MACVTSDIVDCVDNSLRVATLEYCTCTVATTAEPNANTTHKKKN